MIRWCDCAYVLAILVHLRFLRLFEAGEGWFWERAWNHLFTVCINLIKGIWNRAAPLILPRFSSKSKNQRSCALTRPIFFPLPQSRGPRYCTYRYFKSRNIFFNLDRFPHVIFIFSKRTQRHYFCDQDQTLDIFAGARAEDSAIMMVANIRRARHSLWSYFKERRPLLPKLNLIIKTSYKYSPI